jgi:hypothetical protein
VSTKRTLGVGLAVAAALLTAACAAGQHAATADERPTFNGVNGDVGPIHIRGMVIDAPLGPSYSAGEDAQVKLVLVNVGNKPDRFDSISSPAFADWGAVKTSTSCRAGQPAPTATTAPSSQQVILPEGCRVSWGTPEATGTLSILSLSAKVFPGTTIPITLHFAQAGSITLRVPVALSGSPNTSPIPEPSSSSIEG